MKSKIFVALSSLALGVGVHLYLTAHFYPLHLGFATGQSICNINAKFDCDAVSASAFSTLLGIPLSVWGAVTNAILFIMVLASWLGLARNSQRLLRYAFGLATLSLSASVVMGLIALTQLDNYCLFCIAAYVFSLISFEALRRAQTDPVLSNLTTDLKALWGESKAALAFFVAIPAIAFLTDKAMMENYGADQLQTVVSSMVKEWQANAPVTLDAEPSLTAGASAEKAKMVIAEFADFRCGHCKAASPSLNSFVKSHPDVRMMFYVFPLDGACNKAIEHGDGISCRLAKAVVCANRQNLGWEMHEGVFDKQDAFHSASTVAGTDSILHEISSALKVDWTALTACMDDPKTDDAVRSQAELGVKAQVRGTPSIFVNGKRLDRGQLLSVLSAVREALISP